MKTKQIFFFTESVDIEPILKEMESLDPIHYFLTGLFDSSQPVHYNSIFQAPDPGYVTNGDWNHNASYLVMLKDVSVKVRTVPQRKGGMKFSIDQKENAESCVFKPSGIYSGEVLVGGSLGTISSSDFSSKFMNTFAKLLKRNFDKLGEFYEVGFCFEQGDSIMRTGSLNISKEDMRQIDSLLLTSQPLSNGGKMPPRDAFSFVLKVDGVNRIEANYSNVSIEDILKVLRPYFPEEKRDYDFWEFFKTREESDLPDTPANGLNKLSVYNYAFTIILPDSVEESKEPQIIYGNDYQYIGFFTNKDSTISMKVKIDHNTSKRRLAVFVEPLIKHLKFFDASQVVLETEYICNRGRR